MVFHMNTTLNIDDTLMAQLKREAVRQKRTVSELVETALRGLFRSQKKPDDVPSLPSFPAAARESRLWTGMRCTRPWKGASPPRRHEHPGVRVRTPIRRSTRAVADGWKRQRRRADAWYTTWLILYEFLRVTTHPRVMRQPWNVTEA